MTCANPNITLATLRWFDLETKEVTRATSLVFWANTEVNLSSQEVTLTINVMLISHSPGRSHHLTKMSSEPTTKWILPLEIKHVGVLLRSVSVPKNFPILVKQKGKFFWSKKGNSWYNLWSDRTVTYDSLISNFKWQQW